MPVRPVAFIAAITLATPAWTQNMHDYPITPVPFTAVRPDDAFWTPRLQTNRTVTVPYAFQRCDETGRIANFARAGGLEPGAFEGIRYNDSDVFKVVEGAAYALTLAPDPKLDAYLDALIAKIAAAQEDDGYLYTARTLRPDNPPGGCGPARWSYLEHSHELYNVGHLYEAAVAHVQATGKRTLLDVAEKSAALILREFGPSRRHDPPGHQEIEIGLAKLYRLTGRREYLDLAQFFLDQRGRADGRKLYGVYSQDHTPVTEQTEPAGHAVRALYMYSGMADVATLTGDPRYVEAIDRIWTNTVASRLYLTGGLGARHTGEAFGEAYELPNASAYNETCAAIANAMWNHRMFLLHADAKYIDVLERVLYNGFLAGVGFSGKAFFYPNPLASGGNVQRQPWFDCACCPTNVARFLPSIPGYVYAVRADAVYVNLFIGGEADIEVGGQSVRLIQHTRYPWEGEVRLRVQTPAPRAFTLLVRIPGWARNQPVPSDLYRYADACDEPVRLMLNGQPAELTLERGYACIERTWRSGDEVAIELPMPIRRVVAHPNVKDDAGHVALERGPLVYCVEGVDHGGHVRDLVLPDDAVLTAAFEADLLGGVTVLRGQAQALRCATGDAEPTLRPVVLTAIPYYAWCHREAGPMAVWLPRSAEFARVLAPPNLATGARVSASHCWAADTPAALNDRLEPASSGDHGLPRLTWWDRRGTTEWVQCDFREPTTVSKAAVYWFDDTGVGGCRVPARWRLLYPQGDRWLLVPGVEAYPVDKDRYNVVRFPKLLTTSLRVEVDLQPSFSGGILEWVIE